MPKEVKMKTNKSSNTENNSNREKSLVNFLNGGSLTDDERLLYPCSDADLVALKMSILPGSKVVHVGGRKFHHDMKIVGTNGEIQRVELKKSDTNIKYEDLIWRPWEGACQFMQGQPKGDNFKSFMLEFTDEMWKQWFTDSIIPFVDESVPEAKGILYEDYYAIATMAGTGIPTSKKNTKAALFFQLVLNDKSLLESLKQKWSVFLNAWLPSHKPNLAGLLIATKNIIEEKDIWLTINKKGAYWIEGFNVKGLNFKDCVFKQKCYVYQYDLMLQKKSGGDFKSIPVEMRIRLRNKEGLANLSFDLR